MKIEKLKVPLVGRQDVYIKINEIIEYLERMEENQKEYCEDCKQGDHSNCIQFACECPCLPPRKLEVRSEYVDSRTPEERERDSKIESVTTASAISETPEGWEESFDKAFKTALELDELEFAKYRDELFEDFKSFISSLLVKERQKLVKEVERAIKITPHGAFDDLKDNVEDVVAQLRKDLKYAMTTDYAGDKTIYPITETRG